MCYNKQAIKINKPEELKHHWSLPDNILKDWQEKQYTEMLVKCGKCYECIKERGRNWTYKIFLEALEQKEKCFITLTYRDDKNGTQQLDKSELQRFIKRLRKHIQPIKIKYFGAGEYGELKGRPHYHLIILGWQPKDLTPMRKSARGYKMYTSKTIHKMWGLGRISIQRFDYKEVGYLSLYLNQNEKINKKYNKKEIAYKKHLIRELQVKHGILIKTPTATSENRKQKNIYTKVKMIKDLTKKELYKYKKDYNKINVKMKVEPEFNIWSNNIGWESYLKRKYYKYDMIIDNFIYEIPKEYLRKVIENEEYHKNEELYEYTIYHLLERKQKAIEQYNELMGENEEMKDYTETEAWHIVNQEEREKEAQNFTNIKLKKLYIGDF